MGVMRSLSMMAAAISTMMGLEVIISAALIGVVMSSPLKNNS